MERPGIQYKLIGADGKPYGPAGADLIRQWIRENRVERRTPVYVPGATDWTFAGLLPEFAPDFSGPVTPPVQISQPATISPVKPWRSDSMAKAGMICGILSVTVCCCCGGLPFNFLGLMFSIIALVQCAENPQKYGGRDLAIIGLGLSLCGMALSSLALIFHR